MCQPSQLLEALKRADRLVYEFAPHVPSVVVSRDTMREYNEHLGFMAQLKKEEE